MTLVPYLRVSTRDQLDGYGLDVQQKSVRAFSRRTGARLLKACVDEAVTGTDNIDRDGLACALGEIQDGRAHGLLVPSLSRIARRLDLQEAVCASVWGRGGRVFTIEDDDAEVREDDDDDPMRAFVRQVMGAVHQLDAATVAKRLRDGRKAKAAKGGYAGGAPAYGQHSHEKELVVDEAETRVLEQMREWATAGDSLRTIADRLNAADVPTKRGGRWHPTTVARILNEPARESDRKTAARIRTLRTEDKRRRRLEKADLYSDLPDRKTR